MLQCKDIPVQPVLEFIAKVERGETFWYPSEEMKAGWGNGPFPYSSATWYDYEPPFENSVLNAMPSGATDKLALAKMKKLVKQGLVDGCPCGCRGDFVLTDAGRAALSPSAQDPR